MSLEAILHTFFFTPGRKGWGEPFYAWGGPGIGKSDMIEQFAYEWDVPCKVLSPGEQGHAAFGNVPVPSDGVLKHPPPQWAYEMQEEGYGLVFVDEITTATPSLQPALMGLVNNRRIGDAQLPPGVRVFGACNPVEQAAGGWDMAPPLANRAAHIKVHPPGAKQWCDWLLTHEPSWMGEKNGRNGEQKNRLAEEKRVMQLWSRAIIQAKGEVAGFIRAQSQLLYKEPKANDPQASKAWPSHRVWASMTNLLAGCSIHKAGEILEQDIIAGFIGTGAAESFITWRNDLDLPDALDVLNGKTKFKHDKSRLDRTIVVINGLLGLCLEKGVKKQESERRVEQTWEFFASIYETVPPDVMVPPTKKLMNANIHLFTSSKAAQKVQVKILPMLQAIDFAD